MDSFRFLDNSLDNLINTQVPRNLEGAFPIVTEFHPWSDQLPLILQKIPFPYRALSAPPETWSSTPGVLERDFYDNDLRRSKCSEEEHAKIQQLAEDLGLTSFMAYHCCYLWTDVLALADVCEKFSADWLSEYGLEPFHSLTLPAASYTAMLRTVTRMEVWLL